MGKVKEIQDDFTELRAKAEERIKAELDRLKNLSAEEKERIAHDLSVYQVELEMLNEQLRDARHELEESRKNYADLFENAPVGYLVFNRKGVVEKANETAAKLFGTAKKQMENQPFLVFLSDLAYTRFFEHLEKIFKMRSEQSCVIELRKPSGEAFWVKLITTPIRDDEDNFVHFRTCVLPIETPAARSS